MATYDVRTVSISIDRDWREAYDFACRPENFPKWASGLGSNLKRSGEEWFAEGPEGSVRIRFSPRNEFGVVDHTVVTETGGEIFIPLRVIANGTGCEVMFTLFRQPDMSADKFAADAEWVERDLKTLKTLLET
jgi:hypothetical protein